MFTKQISEIQIKDENDKLISLEMLSENPLI